MTAVISGTNGLLQSYDYQVLTTGFTYTFAAGTQVLVINPAGTLATGTITMPASPADGMTITVESTQQVTAVTVSANTGQSIVGAAVQLIPNQPLSWVYRLTNTTWYPLFGGAGRASALVSGTSVAFGSFTTTTYNDWTGIPSWVKRITVMINVLSVSGTSNIQVQLGSGSIDTASYNSRAGQPSAIAVSTNGLLMTCQLATGADTNSGKLVIDYYGSNIWIASGNVVNVGNSTAFFSAGVKTLSGTLDRIRLTTVNLTDTFDAGSANLLFE